jgi:Mg2+-importing ATPase
VETAPGVRAPIAEHRAAIDQHFAECSARGLRVLGLAVRAMPGATGISRADETGLCLVGFLLFADPPKRGLAATLTRLAKLGVALKIITGDNPLVARDVARQIGLGEVSVMTGTELRGLSDDALPRRAVATQVFAEIEPNQKERLILALRKAGHVVGYLGDGINDAPALHAADVGVSVAEAVAVAREAADIVLLERDLEVLIDGICEGRRTFANTLKYVFMATSANFGNMFSMAGASLLLPFLPLLPKQILLNNLLTDLPEMAIASDAVDADWIDRPRRWDVRFIRDFMVCFGLLSSVFDFLTFGALLSLHATPALFRSGWFVESVVSATLIVLVVRTHSPFLQSRPSGYLAGAVVLVVAATVALPYTPLGAVFGFVPLPGHFLLVMAAIVLAYLLAAEWLKRVFYRRHQHASAAASGVA